MITRFMSSASVLLAMVSQVKMSSNFRRFFSISSTFLAAFMLKTALRSALFVAGVLGPLTVHHESPSQASGPHPS